MKSVSGIIGVLLTWLASFDWSYWAWKQAGPPVFFIPLGIVGAILVLIATFRTGDRRLLALALIALLPPFILLAMNGFRI